MSNAITELKKELNKLNPKGIASLILLSIVLAAIYDFFVHNFAVSLLSMIIAIFGCYFLLASFFEEEKPVALQNGEKMVLRTLDMGYIMFPEKKGGFMTKEKEQDLNIYLTNKRIFARKNSGEQVFEQQLSSILFVVAEKKMMTPYIRLTCLAEGKEKQALLFVGNTDLWIQRMMELGVRDTDEFDNVNSTPHRIREEFSEDTQKLRQNIEKKQ